MSPQQPSNEIIVKTILDEANLTFCETADIFQSVTDENADDVLKQVQKQLGILDLGRIAVTIFLLRFPSVQSFVNKGHPLVLATDEYMLENSNAQNWHDYKFIAEEFGWK